MFLCGQPSPRLPSSLAIFIPGQRKNPPGRALGLAPGGFPETRSSLRSSRLSASLLGERVLADGELLVGNRQLAAGGGDDLGVDRAVDRVADEPHGTVAEAEVRARGVAAGRERERPLQGKHLAV